MHRSNRLLTYLATPCVLWAFLAGSAAYGQGGRVGGSGVGYIDNAIPGDLFRFRFDAAYGTDRPDRAEFFYGKCGCFRFDAPPLQDEDASGPPGFPEPNIDYQDVAFYLEATCTDYMSGFVELPFRMINPDTNDNSGGMGDMNFGFKYAFINCEDLVGTFQFRTYVPTGDADRGLGTHNVSIEPALLMYRPLNDCLTLEAECRKWIPIDGTDFAGDILRYGVGITYNMIDTCNYQIRPVAELVAWTVLNGHATLPTAGPRGDFAEDSGGITIVNAKLGVRIGFGDSADLYIGYGTALTDKIWYDDVFRLEFRLFM